MICLTELPVKFKFLQTTVKSTDTFSHQWMHINCRKTFKRLSNGPWNGSFASTPKCQTLRIGTKNMQFDRPTCRLNGVDLENIQEQRDLGVIIDSSLEFEIHINKCAQRAYAAWGIARRTFEKKMSLALFSVAYQNFVRPHVDFSPQVWSPYTNLE